MGSDEQLQSDPSSSKNKLRGNANAAHVESPAADVKRALVEESEYVTIHNGNWGAWKSLHGSTAGYYACGAKVRFEGSRGSKDDTAANALQLKYCHYVDWYTQSDWKSAYDGLWGSWKDPVLCPANKYIDGAQVRFEDSRGSKDDTALNGLKIRCVDLNFENAVWVTVEDGLWGSWKSQVTKSGKLVKDFRIRFESSQGGGDDTAWNGLIFEMETPNNGMSGATITGSWKNVNSLPVGSTYTMTTSTMTTSSQSFTTEQAKSVTLGVEAGFTFSGVEASASVEGTYSTTVASTMSSSISQTVTESIQVACPAIGDSGISVLWQWVMEQPSEGYLPGFEIKTNHYRCTGEVLTSPRCPLGYCSDISCQLCIGDFTPVD